MPVPVPRFSKPPSHPVVKHKQSQTQVADLRSLSSTLPPCPTGPPAAFSTREEWIKSLPAWRRDKPRRIWEDDPSLVDLNELGFPQGLTAAGNAPVIKGTHAQACLPPLRSEYNQFAPVRCNSDYNDDDDDMGSDCSMDHSHFDNQSQWTASSPLQEMEDIDTVCANPNYYGFTSDVSVFHQPLHEGGSILSIYEDRSPGDPVSSPLGPITPFGIFVDRAVADDAPTYPSCGKYYSEEMLIQSSALPQFKDGGNGTFAPFALSVEVEVPREPLPAAETVASSINVQYKKLAEPLANWIADYVWKVCTTGLSLPPPFVAHP